MDKGFDEYVGYVAIIDILGFTEMMQTKDNRWVYENIVLWSRETLRQLIKQYNEEGKSCDEENYDSGSWEAEHTPLYSMFFADTFVLYSNSDDCSRIWSSSEFPFCGLSNILSTFLELALKRELLLRGAITYGRFLLGPHSTIIGRCVAEAHQLALRQNWCGIALCNGSIELPKRTFTEYVSRYQDRSKVAPFFYPTPKLISYRLPQKEVEYSSDMYWVIDWKPDRDILLSLSSRASGAVLEKIQNTLKFADNL